MSAATVRRRAAALFVAVTIGALLALATGRACGFSAQPILSGSMAPFLPEGSLALVGTVPASDVRVGMVLAYQPAGEHVRVAHRVISVNRTADQGTTVQTKGDANNAPDPRTYALSRGEAVRVYTAVPYAGTIAHTLALPLVRLTLAVLSLAAFVLAFVPRPHTRPTAIPGSAGASAHVAGGGAS